MKRLGDVLLAARLITEEQRRNAVTRQAKSGGRLGTALMEEGLPEEALLRVLSVQHHIAAAPPEDLDDVRPEHVRLIPARLARRLGVVPFKRVGTTVSVAMCDPKHLPALDEVAAVTGLSVKAHVACEARVNAALEKYYGVPVDKRFPIIVRRQGRPETQPAAAFEATAPSAPRRSRTPFLRVVPLPPGMGPFDPARNHSLVGRSDSWGVTEGAAASAAAVLPAAEEVGEELRSTGDPSESLAERLAGAVTREHVAEAILEAAGEHVRRAALFIARPDHIVLWAARPAPPGGTHELPLPWSEPSVFATLRNTEGFYVGTYPDLPGTVRALRALGSDGLGTMAVVPVNLKGRTVLFLWGESDSYTRPPSVPRLKRFAAMAATALEIVLLKKRLTYL